MRINNNLMAMNTHRQLGINNANSAKSIEKLSSGLRINNAADDAAGLAISEKMRGQIRGLNQASRNAQDGISMIQTGEGALQETQAILQRMRELSVQAANGTYEDSDRAKIQTEMDQLTSEVNRIGNTTEFNQKSLLDGSLAVTGDGKVLDGAIAAGTTGLGAGAIEVDVDSELAAGDYDVVVTSNTVSKIEGTIQSGVVGATVTADATVESLTGGAYKINITQENAKQIDSINVATDDELLDTTGGNTAITIESNSTLNDATHTIKVDKQQTATDLGSGLEIKAGSLNNVDSGTYTVETSRIIDDTKVADNGADKLKTDSVISNFTMADNATTAQAALINDGNANALTITVVDGGDATAEIKFSFSDGTNTTDVSLVANAGDGAQTVQVAGLQFDVDVDKIIAGLDLTDAVADTGTYDSQVINIASGAALDQVKVTSGGNSDTQTIASNSNGDLAFDLDGGGADITLTSTGADFIQGNSLSTAVQSEYTVGLYEGAAQIGVDTVVDELDLADPTNVSNLSFGGSGVLVDLDVAALQGKSAGNYTIDFDVDTDTAYTAELQKADGSAVDGAKFTLDSAAGAGTKIDLGHDVDLTYTGGTLAAGEVFFGVQDDATEFSLELKHDGGATIETKTISAGDDAVFADGITVKTDGALANGTADFTLKNDTVDNSVSMQIGANVGQSFNVDVNDMRSSKLGISSDVASATKGLDIDGDGTTDFTAVFNATGNVTNGNDTEYSLNIMNHENATAAVEVINDAIEKVSAERSKLGSLQNRLDHTIKNLDTSSENLVAAESRIRDVDMAKEMMEQSKNSILSQAAQAMLAQAKQAPQGVLQLLR